MKKIIHFLAKLVYMPVLYGLYAIVVLMSDIFPVNNSDAQQSIEAENNN